MNVGQIRKAELEKLVVVTHWKQFHADDVMAVALLKYFLVDVERLFKHTTIKRIDYNKMSGTEIKNKYTERCGNYVIVVDVGRVYNPKQGLFDHHQFTKEEDGRASAGMVFDWLVSEGVIAPKLANKLEPLIRYIDANDIGVRPAKTGEYSWMIRHLNRDYNSTDDEHYEAFTYAVEFTIKILDSLYKDYIKAEKAKDVLYSGKVVLSDVVEFKDGVVRGFYGLELPEYPDGWTDVIYDKDFKNVDIIIYPDTKTGEWKAQTVNVSNDSYEKRGRKITVDEDYISKPDNGIVFVHKGEFFMVAKDRDSLYKYLRRYLTM